MLPGILQKALLWSAFFVSGFWISAAHASCEPEGPGRLVSVRHVIDGDTLVLADGARVRLIGVNSPELGYRGARDEPYAQRARQWLQQRVLNKPVRMMVGKESRDRYGRTLAHVVDSTGMLLAQGLIAQGLGYALGIAPNTDLADCLFAREREARAGLRGLWRDGAVGEVTRLAADSAGFGVWRGRVSASGKMTDGAYLEVENRVFIALYFDGADRLVGSDSEALAGRLVEFRGWLLDRKKSDNDLKKKDIIWFMRVSDERHLRLLD